MLCYAMLGALDASYGKVFDPFFVVLYLHLSTHFCIHFCIYFHLFSSCSHGVIHISQFLIYKRTTHTHSNTWASKYLFAQIDWCDVRLEENWRLVEVEKSETKGKEMNIMCSNISRQLFNVTFCVVPRCSKCCPLLLFFHFSPLLLSFFFRLDIIYYITWKWVKYMRTEMNIGWIVCAYVRNEMIRCACA